MNRPRIHGESREVVCVEGEFLDAPERQAARESLANARKQIQIRGMLPVLLKPKELRQMARRLDAAHRDEVVKLGVEHLHLEADTKIIELELAAEQRRGAMLAHQNEQMGSLKQRQTGLAADAMRDEVRAERRRQAELGRCDCLQEDRALLAKLYQHRAAENITRIAAEHGVPMTYTDAASPSPNE